MAGLGDFTSVLADETGFAGLKRSIGAIAEEDLGLDEAGESSKGKKRKAKLIETPLAKVHQDRIERKVAYSQTAKEISKWQPIVQHNRQADTLSFPLNAPSTVSNVTSKSIVATHEPKTDFEREMQQALESAGMATEGDICRLEEMEMNKLSVNEIEARFAELSKKRSLLFFQERKQKHQSKIKSKKFHKIKSKEKAKEQAKQDAQLSAQERREKAEIARAKERLTLRTRKANKWAQEMIHRRGIEPGSRQEIVEQLRDKERLRQEIFGKARETRDEEEEEDSDLYLSSDEGDGNDKVNKDYFESDEEEEEEAEQLDKDVDYGQDDEDDEEGQSEEEAEGVIGRRTFGEAAKTEAQKKPRKTGKSNRDSLFQAADDDEQLQRQQKIIKQAFAEDDLFAEFAAEKQGIIDADAPKEIDMTLPGWGNWVGEGVEWKPKTRIIKKTEGVHVGTRKDAKLKHVIINEKQNKKLNQTWMVPKVPFPFKSQEEYERANRAKPLGPEWNTTTGYRKRIEPRIQVKVGSIIDPIKFVKQPKQ